jgi:RNA polymerase sigma factor (sigma-70 family)
MESRTQILDMFSTFAFLEGDYFRRWVSDPRLRRSMEKSTASIATPTQTDKFWSVYWYKKWQSQSHCLAESHLTAYLQETCYWAAQQISQRSSISQYTFGDYFQITNSEIQRVLKSFSSDRGSTLKSYASLVLSNVLKETLRRRQAAEICSDWSLLYRTSKKRIRDVLVHSGIAEPELSQYQLLWFCFTTQYVPFGSTGELSQQLDAHLWRQITDLYNTKRQGQLSVTGAELSPEQIETRLAHLGRWIRNYLYPTIDSLNRLKPSQEGGEIQDDLFDPTSQNLVDLAIEVEDCTQRTIHQSKLQSVLEKAIELLDPEYKEILRLFYQDQLSQLELADRLKVSQPTVSRRMKKAEEQLLSALLVWVQSALNEFPDPNTLKVISSTLREWLNTYYGHKI